MTAGKRYHVVWRVYPQLDLVQMSGLLTGLAILKRRGVISLAVEYIDRVCDSLMTMELIVTEIRSGRTKQVVFDFHDRGDKIYPDPLDFADLYYKRQCGPETRPAAGPAGAHKIRPLGMTVAGFSRPAWRLVAAAIYGSLHTSQARQARPNLTKLLRQAYNDARLWLLLPPPDSARANPTDAKQPLIVFQPRLWMTTPGSGDVFDVANDDRVETVRVLQRAFPDMATIGIVHSPFAKQVAEPLLLHRHVNTEEHHRQLRSATVAVNCVGLSGSVGWKFAEYLAAGCAVVSQPIDKEFLAPIEAGVHYLPYHSPAECVELCRRLLDHPDLMARMGEVNRAYFEQWVNPPVHALHLLNRSFEET
ncbi:MAG: glycosyltransferase family 1 protein [Gemmatimonadales bacterium]|nr:glycosyltransferase family 1 protein [Gemmatimonadales bacterium]